MRPIRAVDLPLREAPEVDDPELVSKADGRVVSMAEGRAVYRWSARRRPFVHPLRTPAGDLVTVDAPDDHPWHHGLWFAIKYVNGDNYWEEVAPYGVVRHHGPPRVEGTRAEGAATGGLEWIAPDRTTVVIREERTWRWCGIDAPSPAYALDLTARLVPTLDVVLDRTPFTTWGGYGGLTLRGAPDWTGTRFTLGGLGNRDRVLGEPAPWCDTSGRFPSGGHGGVLLCDHPSNPRHPVPWYGSTRNELYGDGWSNFVCAAFLFGEPMPLGAGEVLELRHRVVVHDGEWDAATCEQQWRAWIDAPPPPA